LIGLDLTPQINVRFTQRLPFPRDTEREKEVELCIEVCN